jgi:cell division protein FtsL
LHIEAADATITGENMADIIVRKENKVKKTPEERSVVVQKILGLSLREKVLIIALVAALVIAGGLFFVVNPAFEKISAIEQEIATLEDQRTTYEMAISETPLYKEQYEKSKVTYEELQKKFLVPMTPEALDKFMTGMILSSEFEITSLNMSTLQPIVPSAYIPQTLEGSLLETMPPEVVNDGDAEEQPAEETAADSGSDASSALVVAGSGGTPAVGSISAYTVNVSVSGDNNMLNALFGLVNATDNVVITNVAFTPPSNEDDADDDTEDSSNTVDKPSIAITFRVYVFVGA